VGREEHSLESQTSDNKMGSAKNRSYAKRRRAASIGDDVPNASIGLLKHSCWGKTPYPEGACGSTHLWGRTAAAWWRCLAQNPSVFI